MKQKIKVPSAGESVTSANIGEWQKKDGDYVQQNDVLVVMETDKASMDLVAEHSGKLKILKQAGEEVEIAEVIAEIDTSAVASETEIAQKSDKEHFQKPNSLEQNASSSQSHSSQSHSSQSHSSQSHSSVSTEEAIPRFPSDQIIAKLLTSQSAEKNSLPSFPPHSLSVEKDGSLVPSDNVATSSMSAVLSPAVRKLVVEHKLNPSDITGSGPKGRKTKEDVLRFISQPKGKASLLSQNNKKGDGFFEGHTETTRKKMTTIRKRIAERLVLSQQSTATLTTFNEIDMSQVMSLRTQYKEAFQKKHNIKLGFMGFFIKAVVCALKTFPRVNAFIEGDEIVYHHTCHIGVAVSTERGLVVPVIRNADQMDLPEIEQAVLFYAEKARDGKISPDDLMGGTFTISNGGVFGSLLSTPILNPPQSGILGMHKIEQRPVAVDGQVKIKPMMYVALSYDHRIVDGKESVGFLLKVKECVEDPFRLLINV